MSNCHVTVGLECLAIRNSWRGQEDIGHLSWSTDYWNVHHESVNSGKKLKEDVQKDLPQFFTKASSEVNCIELCTRVRNVDTKVWQKGLSHSAISVGQGVLRMRKALGLEVHPTI